MFVTITWILQCFSLETGIKFNSSLVFPSECAQITNAPSERGAPACNFTNVHPDGEVHWFHGSHSLSDGPIKHKTMKRVDEGGWLIIYSELIGWKNSDVPYNCSLKGSRSGEYIASAKVPVSRVGSVHSPSSGATSQASMRTLLCISILLAVTLK